jgi:hypothetical protein
MLTCPNCHKKNMLGSIFCSDCGVQLVYSDDDIAERDVGTSVPPNIKEFADHPSATSNPPDVPDDHPIALFIQETNELVPLIDREEITLGRAIEGQPIIPDLDLTPYNGYEKGVSRLHASIKINGNHVTITDLGSANGTRVNGIKLSPNQPQTVIHGDMITLGRLITQILIRS